MAEESPEALARKPSAVAATPEAMASDPSAMAIRPEAVARSPSAVAAMPELERQPDHAVITFADSIQRTSPVHTIGAHCEHIKEGAFCRAVRSLAAQVNVVCNPVLRFFIV
ncbi:hypothetical protein SynBMKMC1_01943 [Synechococcus sp. BMK-MC-1]|nr:hypothetical protein SynBMKMC1_01943 [Synechococcus sp. BMK-MC-1]